MQQDSMVVFRKLYRVCVSCVFVGVDENHAISILHGIFFVCIAQEERLGVWMKNDFADFNIFVVACALSTPCYIRGDCQNIQGLAPPVQVFEWFEQTLHKQIALFASRLETKGKCVEGRRESRRWHYRV